MTKFNRFDPRNKKNNRNKKNTQNNTVKIKSIYEDKMKYDITALIKKNDNERETQ